ncbi:hypothetical protein X975_11095, partial [Stegodyphus mimosarum]
MQKSNGAHSTQNLKIGLYQGCHTTWKTGKSWGIRKLSEKFSKYFSQNLEKSGNFMQRWPRLEVITFLVCMSITWAIGIEPVFVAPIRLPFRKAKQVSSNLENRETSMCSGCCTKENMYFCVKQNWL